MSLVHGKPKVLKTRSEIKAERMRILKEINTLTDTQTCLCTYTDKGAIITRCSRCTKLMKLGKQLDKVGNPRQFKRTEQVKTKEVPKRTKPHQREYNGQPLKYKMWKDKKVACWDEAMDWLSKNSMHYTVKEMCKKLGVREAQLRNVYVYNGFEYKSHVTEYKYFVFDELVDVGTIPYLSEKYEIPNRTMRKWKDTPGRKGQRLVEVD